MSPKKAISLTIQSRKEQKPTQYFSPVKKVKFGSIESMQGDYKLLDGGKLMRLYFFNLDNKIEVY